MKKFVVLILFLFFNCFLSYCEGSEVSDENTIQVPLCDKCISCICLAISNCDKSWKCEGDVCGMFRITEGYWTDAGQLTIPGDDSTSAYQNCTNDEECATKTVQSYLTKYAQDCDGNGRIDCDDYAAIHKYGGFGGCQENPLSSSGSYGKAIHKCMKN